MDSSLHFADLWPQWPFFLSGFLATLILTAFTVPIGLLVGLAGALIRLSHLQYLSFIWGGYVELIRNTPFIIQLFFIVFGLPALGCKLSPTLAAVSAMIINLGAYSTEILRAAIQVTDPGQREAGRVLGLTRSQTFWHIILQPALQRVYPALVSQCIIVMLGSSVVSQVAFQDLTYVASLIQARTFLSFEVYLLCAALYLLLAQLLRAILMAIGKKSLGGPC